MQRPVEISISPRTILLVSATVAVAWAMASIKNVLLVIFVSLFSVAVLSPVVTAMEQRLGWSRGRCAALLIAAVVAVMGGLLLVVVQSMSDAVHRLSHDLPEILQRARDSNLGASLNNGSNWVETLKVHAADITGGVGGVSGGVAHVGLSALGAMAAILSVVFLTLFGLVDEIRAREWVGGLLYPQNRERVLDVTDRIIRATSRYMLGNIAISVICGAVYGTAALILGVPYPLALAVIAGILDLIPNIGATIAGIIVTVVALSVSLGAVIAFLIVMIVYQQFENYVLQPTIIGKAAKIPGFTVLASVLAFGALFGVIGAVIAVPIAAGLQIVTDELTVERRARIAAAEADEAGAGE
jgi:predicted PurR-regulated permease PerM